MICEKTKNQLIEAVEKIPQEILNKITEMADNGIKPSLEIANAWIDMMAKVYLIDMPEKFEAYLTATNRRPWELSGITEPEPPKTTDINILRDYHVALNRYKVVFGIARQAVILLEYKRIEELKKVVSHIIPVKSICSELSLKYRTRISYVKAILEGKKYIETLTTTQLSSKEIKLLAKTAELLTELKQKLGIRAIHELSYFSKTMNYEDALVTTINTLE